MNRFVISLRGVASTVWGTARYMWSSIWFDDDWKCREWEMEGQIILEKKKNEYLEWIAGGRPMMEKNEYLDWLEKKKNDYLEWLEKKKNKETYRKGKDEYFVWLDKKKDDYLDCLEKKKYFYFRWKDGIGRLNRPRNKKKVEE
ncbi:hypothetical protein DPMN_034112 [Dreissena polymorpha]|uniref:Uncharacterized protein n=1 Tax=Dreissena polymorpha TaxID=45954 RepID=A0A9D4M521_DREPO|nr:hypothetical protein DPMN_034112 [Dreissena polymorpha]